MNKNAKQMKKQAEWVQQKVRTYVRNYFFDENNPTDSDISSHHSDSEKSNSKHEKSSKNGLNMLMKATRKIDERAQARNKHRYYSTFQNTSNKPTLLRKFSVTENSFLPPAGLGSAFNKIDSPQMYPSLQINSEGSNPSFIDLLLKQSLKTRSYSCDLPNITPGFVQNVVEPSSSIENMLTEYLISLPTCLEEFYKVMGELYVSEILKYRPDIDSPVQLMKELLLGRLNVTNGELRTNNLVAAMMEQAARENETQNLEQNPVEAELLNCLLEDSLKRDITSNLRSFEPPVYNDDQNMVDPQLETSSLKELGTPEVANEPKQSPPTPNSKAEIKKRDYKAEQKELEDKLNISELDTGNNTKAKVLPKSTQIAAPESAEKEKLKETPQKNESEPPLRKKRAPKKSNQRVFLPKISNKGKQSQPAAKRMCTEECIDEFCKKLVEETIDRII